MKKQYQDVGVQKANLIKNKHIKKETIDDEVFNEKTYLNLINPYSDLIAIGRDAKGKHTYLPENSFDNYIECNKLDHTICLALHEYIGCFEKRLKCYIMHVVCKKLRDSGDRQAKDLTWIDDCIANRTVFNFVKIKKTYKNGVLVNADPFIISKREKALNEIKEASNILKISKNPMIEHYRTEHGYIPFYVSIHTLSLGGLISLFGMFHRDDKNQFIADLNRNPTKIYSDSAIEKFDVTLKRINDMRNIVNHYESIFPFILKTSYNAFTGLTNILKLLKTNFTYSKIQPQNSINLFQLTIPWNSYTRDNHRKISDVVNALI